MRRFEELYKNDVLLTQEQQIQLCCTHFLENLKSYSRDLDSLKLKLMHPTSEPELKNNILLHAQKLQESFLNATNRFSTEADNVTVEQKKSNTSLRYLLFLYF